MKSGRKYSVIVMVSVLISLGMVAGVIAAINEANLPWLATTLPILTSVYPPTWKPMRCKRIRKPRLQNPRPKSQREVENEKVCFTTGGTINPVFRAGSTTHT